MRRLGLPFYASGDPIGKGDWVKVWTRSWGGVWHHGIVRRVVWCYGGYLVEIIHNSKDGGVKISEWYDFAGCESIVFLVARPSSPEHANDIVARAEVNIRTPYIFFSRNCEHFASFCFNGEAKSETMDGFGKLALYSLGGFVVAKFIDSVTQKPKARR
jgi:hypothetical protein